MLATAVAVLALAGFGLSINIGDCPSGITKDKYLLVYKNYCFQFVLNSNVQQIDANNKCESYGGVLAVVKNPETQKFIYKALTDTYNCTGKVWIGLTDKETENRWVWEDGTRMTYENWEYGEGPKYRVFPHHFRDCTYLDAGNFGKWFDASCTNELWELIKHENNYVCQYEI